jgi:twitching motility protein PilT
MFTADHVREFRDAPWTDAAAARDFVARVMPVTSEEILKLLALLLQRKLVEQTVQHGRRCEVFRALAEPVPDRNLFQVYLRALATADPIVTPILVELLRRTNNPALHSELCGLLDHAEKRVRVAAAQALSSFLGPNALQMLCALAAKKDFAGRVEAIQAALPRGQHHSLPLIKTVLACGRPEERVFALRAALDPRVAEKDPANVRALLEAAVTDKDEQLQAEAIGILPGYLAEDDFWRLVGPVTTEITMRVAQAFLNAIAKYPTARTVDTLERVLHAPVAELRTAACDALRELPPEMRLKLLVEAATDAELTVSQRAIEALAAVAAQGGELASRCIFALLMRSDPKTRRIAAEIAHRAKVGLADLIPAFMRSLRDEDWWVRERVVDALIEIDARGLAWRLVALLADPEPTIRRFAICSLRRVKDPQIAGRLIEVIKSDTDWWVREEAVSLLGELGRTDVIVPLTKLLALDSTLWFVTVRSLHQLGARQAATDVARVIANGDAAVRHAAIEFLTEHGEKAHQDYVLSLPEDVDPQVRAAVLRLKKRRETEDVGIEVRRTALGALDLLLTRVNDVGGDDLVIAEGRPPAMKSHGAMERLAEAPLPPDAVRQMILATMSDMQKDLVSGVQEVDYSYEVKGTGVRFRVNAFKSTAGLSAVFRVIRSKLPSLDQLGLPQVVQELQDARDGLVLVGGTVGSGKSTTLAALINAINGRFARHIITLEDPIEYSHPHQRSLVTQRELFTHTGSFEDALRSTLRQDPDVILVGEMRDYSTVSYALTAAETGHLVFGTVHTVSADACIDRLLTVFPAGQREQVRSMLSESLRAVICQQLVPKKGGGRALACEILINNTAVSALIRKGKDNHLRTVMTTQRDAGMQLMDDHLVALVQAGVIDADEARARMREVSKLNPNGERAGAPPGQAGRAAAAAAEAE